jgi:hypothetical protein
MEYVGDGELLRELLGELEGEFDPLLLADS